MNAPAKNVQRAANESDLRRLHSRGSCMNLLNACAEASNRASASESRHLRSGGASTVNGASKAR